MARTKEINGKIYHLRAVFNQKVHATKLAKINRSKGFSVRIVENDIRGKVYEVWARQSKPGYAIDWWSLRSFMHSRYNVVVKTTMYNNEVEMD